MPPGLPVPAASWPAWSPAPRALVLIHHCQTLFRTLGTHTGVSARPRTHSKAPRSCSGAEQSGGSFPCNPECHQQWVAPEPGSECSHRLGAGAQQEPGAGSGTPSPRFKALSWQRGSQLEVGTPWLVSQSQPGTARTSLGTPQTCSRRNSARPGTAGPTASSQGTIWSDLRNSHQGRASWAAQVGLCTRAAGSTASLSPALQCHH